MSLNIDAIRNRLNKLQTTQKRALELWKPTPGKHQIRIVPYKHDRENPFIELYFHYNINNRTYLSPISFGRPDPIVEFSDKLKRMGDREDFQTAKKMQPKLRTFAPVLVRGEEGEGVRFWGFGKTVYQEILGYIADPDYGDITHPTEGRDIVVEIISAEDAGTSFPMTKIRVKPNTSPLADSEEEMKKLIENQEPITSIYQELSYDELKTVLQSWLNPDAETEGQEEEKDNKSVAKETLSKSNKDQSTSTESQKSETSEKKEMTPEERGKHNTDWLDDDKEDTSEKSEEAPKKEKKKDTKVDDVASAFDDLFES